MRKNTVRGKGTEARLVRGRLTTQPAQERLEEQTYRAIEDPLFLDRHTLTFIKRVIAY